MNDNEIANEIARSVHALKELGDAYLNLWKHISIAPAQWHSYQYPDHSAWVAGIMGKKCLYYNTAENGWGWGSFTHWGHIDGYHWQQDEISHVVAQKVHTILSSI